MLVKMIMQVFVTSVKTWLTLNVTILIILTTNISKVVMNHDTASPFGNYKIFCPSLPIIAMNQITETVF